MQFGGHYGFGSVSVRIRCICETALIMLDILPLHSFSISVQLTCRIPIITGHVYAIYSHVHAIYYRVYAIYSCVYAIYNKTCIKRPLKNIQNKGPKDKW